MEKHFPQCLDYRCYYSYYCNSKYLFMCFPWINVGPYGNTGEIPVAVVNEDKEVTYNDSSLAVGEELVKNLEDNDSMNFHFVNAEDANKGLEKGDYYMVITIPENFSKNATTLLDDQPQKMILNYTTNPRNKLYLLLKWMIQQLLRLKLKFLHQ